MPSAPDAEPLPSWLRVGVPAAVFLLSFLCFTPALDGEFLNWDDNLVLTDHDDWRGLGGAEIKKAFTNLRAGHYHPLTWLTYGLDYTLWQMNPRGYHLVNLLLHATTATLFYAILVFLLERTGRFAGRETVSRLAAAAGALFFAIHPLRVESVAWITERRDVLSGCFLVLTLLAWLRWTEGGERRRSWYAIALVSFALSLLSKAWGMTLPVVLLIMDLYPLRRWAPGRLRPLLLEKAPLFLMAFAAGGIAIFAQKTAGAMSLIEGHTLFDRFIQSGYGLTFYVVRTILPVAQNPLVALKSSFDPMEAAYLGGAILAAVITAALIRYRRQRPGLLAAWAIFVVTVSPVLGLTQAGPQLVAERYTYLACLPFAVLAAFGLAWAMDQPKFGGVKGTCIAASAVLAALGFGAWSYCHEWRDSLSLWSLALRRDPENAQAWLNLGSAKLLQDRKDEAYEDLSRAIQLNPTYADSYINRGNASMPKDPDAAIRDYEAALKLKPNYAIAYTNRAIARITKNDREGGLADFDRALQSNPDDARALLYRGLTRLQGGDVKGARADLDRTIQIKPGDPDPWYYRSLSWEAENEVDRALRDVTHALSIASRKWMFAGAAENLLNRLRSKKTGSK